MKINMKTYKKKPLKLMENHGKTMANGWKSLPRGPQAAAPAAAAAAASFAKPRSLRRHSDMALRPFRS